MSSTAFELSVSGRPVRGAVALPAGDTPAGGRPWVALVHGFRSHRRWGFFPDLTRALVADGLAVVGFDFSGSGIGPDETFTSPELFCGDTYSKQLEDLDAVLSHVQGGELFAADPRRGALLGHSRGAGISLLTAAERTDLRAVCLWACITRVASWTEEKRRAWRERGYHAVPGPITGELMHLTTEVIDDADRSGARFDLPAAAARLACSAQLVHGDRDSGLPLEEVQDLLRHFPTGRARLEVIAGARHDFSARRGHLGPVPLGSAIEVSRRFLVSELSGAS